MNLHVFLIHISIMLLLVNGCFSKTLSERSEIDSESEENQNSEDATAIHENRHHSFRHGKENLKKHSRRGRSSSGANDKQYAIMYKHDEPVGILQHFHNGYQLLPIRNDESIPVDIEKLDSQDNAQNNEEKREIPEGAELGEETPSKGEDSAKFADEKYPYIFAKFKIDTKIEKENQKAKTLEKRDSKVAEKSPLLDKRHVTSLNSALSRIQTNDEAAEVELRGILHDMGLIEEPHMDKRDAEQMEDENLEYGTNKIDLIKMEDSKPKAVKRSRDEMEFATKHYGRIAYPDPKYMNEDKIIDEYISQHPDKFKKLADDSDKERGKRGADNVEEQMEKQIKDRLQKIKEEVRSEIDKLKAGNNENAEEENGDEVEDDENKAERKKRNIISTLVEEETSDLNPVIVADENPVPHVRRRRSLDIEENEDRGSSTLPSSHQQATVGSYSQRKLLDASNYYDEMEVAEFPDFTDGREKKSCKCEGGKDCKCGKQKSSYMVGPDGSNFVYFDGAPMLLSAPFHPVAVDAIHHDSMKLNLANDIANINPSKPAAKRHAGRSKYRDGKYKLELNPETYKITKDNSNWVESFRKKRSSFLDLVALHGGGPVLDHLVAIRQRSMVPNARSKRMAEGSSKQLTLVDMSDDDLFGAAPEDFEGDELVRLKRVKRED